MQCRVELEAHALHLNLMVGSVVTLVKAVEGRVDVILGILEGFTHPDGDWKPEF